MKTKVRAPQLLVAASLPTTYLGKYAIGKIFRGKLKKGESLTIARKDVDAKIGAFAGAPSIAVAPRKDGRREPRRR